MSLRLVKLWLEGAEAEFKRAIQLNPKYSSGYYFYALNYLVPMGKLDEAAAELRRARELEPFSLIINTNLGVIFYYQGRYEQAIEQYRKALELNPRFVTARLRLIDVYTETGRFDEALAEHELIVTPNGASVYVSNHLSHDVSVFATASNTLVNTVAVGTTPRELAITPDGKFVFVANFCASWSPAVRCCICGQDTGTIWSGSM